MAQHNILPDADGTMIVIRLHLILLFLPFALRSVAAFASCGRRPLKKRTTWFASTATSASGDTGVAASLDGVADFEEWFSSHASSGAKVKNIRHAFFNSTGRGLQFTSSKSSDLKKVAVVPRKLVLRVPYSDEDHNAGRSSWDSILSCMLWEECRKGKDSAYYG